MASDSSSSSVQRVILSQIRNRLRPLTNQPGIHTSNYLKAAGFVYTGNGDAAQCVDCGLEVSGWTRDMVPFTIHIQQRPSCRFINSMRTPLASLSSVVPNTITSTQIVRETISVPDSAASPNIDHSSTDFVESNQLKQTRIRSFSHWPQTIRLSITQMIDAGFFCCNVEDRVICIYCNLICQGWTSDTYDPCLVHKKLSPNCIYVKGKLVPFLPLPIINDNQRSTMSATRGPSLALNNSNSPLVNGSIHPAGQINSSQNNQVQSIDESIQENYFYTDANTTGFCLSCRKAFHNLDSGENPMIDHARRYPNCPYVQQFQAVAIYRTTQNIQPPLVWTREMISTMVADRLNWPMSQVLLRRNYSLFVIKKCWEDQLRIKGEDFLSDIDLQVACLIVQKQLQHIRAQKRMIIPRERMRQLRENEIQAQQEIREQIWAAANRARSQEQSPDLEPLYKCVICLSAKKHLAILPCGHLVACVICGDQLQTCPICRGPMEGTVLIFT